MTDEKKAEQLSYEQARAELASVVERLEAGGTTLEESLALWERGEKLADDLPALARRRPRPHRRRPPRPRLLTSPARTYRTRLRPRHHLLRITESVVGATGRSTPCATARTTA